jgi:hypothetical protein
MRAHTSTLLVLVSVGLFTVISLRATSQAPTQLASLSDEVAQPELALLMGELQRLTHKMALSADAGNAELASFYMHESLEQMKKIQTEVPEYEGQPVALLMDRMGLPTYAAMQEAVNAKDKQRMLTALDAVVQSCNACHAATLHPFIRITRGTEVNPFNQSFQP